ncbi:MAG: hypothetical protein P4M11_12990 [Candidatus Pacebacteria bacterium]|nr:hypothetical protein [Candidatus Paceibacterota bacterium]
MPVPTFKRALPADPVPDLLEPLHSLKRPDLPSRDEDAETKEQECNSSRIRERRSLPPAPQERPRFTSLVFRGVTYSVNDFLYVREAPLSNMVGQLRRVIGQGGDPSHPKWPMVELEWYSVISVTLNRYFRKTDLDQTALGLGAAEWASLADNELFSTSFVSKIHADLLNGKCMVWQLSEYEKQESLDENDFFTRASYDIRKARPDFCNTAIENDKSALRLLGTHLHLPDAHQPQHTLCVLRPVPAMVPPGLPGHLLRAGSRLRPILLR